ncbi:MAG TPA: sigma-70 family RNA polymerase sigma factor [Gemmatimonadaceae bacterium]|nr:sigma-70 family RNA polymerase sigma factor [Gemmatimonadaceae bacterium]
MPPLRLVPHDAPRQEDGSFAETRSLVIHAARAGDVRAFATLVDMYYARCLRFALHMLADRSDAEEAVQDTFVRVYRALPSYREQDSFEPWLFRILGNRCRTAGAKQRRHADVMEYGDVPERATAAGHDRELAWREEIERALRSLPVEQREAFLMRHVEGMSYEDMAVATGAGLSALKMRVKRACDALRVQLTEVDGV